ncbi:MAG: PSD1 domain-containing protein [Candidatus Hydrogenedentes bacterium]|nr:PSD1 domain-containing protein [Candidatus Hydrogenedentota bacterium]
MKTYAFTLFIAAGAFAATGHAAAEAAAPGDPIQFNQDIRPILSDKCFACHGPDDATRKAGLRLDSLDGATAALKSGKQAIVPSDPAASVLIARITAEDPNDRMPPADHPKQLTTNDIDVLTRWIAEGAPWEEHWSFQPIIRPELPETPNPAWVKNPVDAFILHRMAAKGVSPAPEADKRTLVRRLYLDLTGLPPTIEQVEAFMADPRHDAYERLADRLLDSTEHAEHLARYWLDAARYSDTNGYHIDNERYMWPWRDWVIRAFQENKPFNDFTVEQLAGDLLTSPSKDQLIASGFNRNHMINFEGGIIPEEYQTAYVMDRVDATSTVWLGLTMACVQCHEHKYDPISHDEYYKMYAFFNTIEEQGIDGRDGNAVPLLRASTDTQDAKLARFNERVRTLEEAMDGPMPEVDAAQAAWEEASRARLQNKWRVLTPASAASTGGSNLTVQEDGSVLAGGENPAADTYEIEYALTESGITGLRLELLPDPASPNASIGRSDNGNVVISEIEVETGAATGDPNFQRLEFVSADVDYAQPNLGIAKAIDGKPETGYGAGGHEAPGARTAVFVPRAPFGYASGTRLKLRIRHESEFAQHAAARVRLAVTANQDMALARLDQWYIAGPYTAADGDAAYNTAFEPEQGIDLEATYPDGRQKWQLAVPGYEDGKIHSLSGRVCATYLYRKVIAPTARKTTLSVGSNDAVKIWLNGRVVHDNNTQRGVAADQDRVEVNLEAGENELLMKVVNYGNAYAFYFKNTNEQTGEFPIGIELALAKAPDARTDAESAQLRTFYRRANSPQWRDLDAQLAQSREERTAFEKTLPTSMVMREMAEPRETFVLLRGQYDAYGEKVEPGVPAVLPPMPEEAPKNRLGLAEWLVSPNHPLTSRVTINRFWQQYFGAGLVRTAEDFGSQGEMPSHPALLDWLAAEFMESGWDVRHMHRLIVTSATYRQSSARRPELKEIPGGERLIATGPRFRLDAEVVRDNALAVSGLLRKDVGGPSVRPYQPLGLWEEVAYGAGFTAQKFELGDMPHLHRRSMYTFWKRTSPPPTMMLFDAPNRETCTVKRSRSNTPLQALALLNDPQFVEAARFLAERMLTEAGDSPEVRINHAFLLTLARPARPEEMAVLRGLYEKERAAFASEPARATDLLAVGMAPANPDLDPGELAAWSTVASVILNMDETITKT